MWDLDESRLMPRMRTPLGSKSSLSWTMCAASAMHGAHQVAQKSTTTILPRRLARLMGVPSAAWKERSGLSPTLTIACANELKERIIARERRSLFMAILRSGFRWVCTRESVGFASGGCKASGGQRGGERRGPRGGGWGV